MSEESLTHFHSGGDDLVVSLIQAFLRTGDYLPDHPQSQTAKEALYEGFVPLANVSGDLHFYIREEDGEPTAHVEGLGESAVRLKEIMPLGMVDTCIPGFVNFMEQKELISLTLSARMGPDEFSRFIDLMSDPAFVEMGETESKKRFTDSIRLQQIRNISWIFNEELIGTGREIPWRVNLALSRLHKDLRVLSIHGKMEHEELARIKGRILHDVTRPLREYDQTYAFLMNLDLAATRILDEDGAEDELLSVMEEKTFFAVVTLLMDDASGKESCFREILPPEKFDRLLGKVCGRLIRIDTRESNDRLRVLYEAGVLSPESLTPEVRERVTLLHLVRSFIDYSDAYLTHLDAGGSMEEFSRFAVPLARIVLYLIEGGWYAEAVAITGRLASRAAENSELTHVAHQALGEIREGPAIRAAKEAFLTVPKEDRVEIGRFFVLMGVWAIGTLREIIIQSDDIWRRKQAADILLEMGPDPASILVDILDEAGVSGDTLAMVVRVLAGVTYENFKPIVVQAVERKVGDPSSDVRREAVRALVSLAPVGKGKLFMSALKDTDPEVQREAVRGLGFAADPGLFDPLRDILARAGREDDGKLWSLAAAAVSALGHLRDGCPGISDEIDSCVLSVSEKAIPRRGLKKLKRPGGGFPSEFLTSLSYTLGRMGGEEAEKQLERMSHLKDDAVAKRARAELEKLRAVNRDR
ncbi:MAG: HEAT repeat domain-containing protein [bacterium]|nr:HEAT repeat domain-containing protein [bacterium]